MTILSHQAPTARGAVPSLESASENRSWDGKRVLIVDDSRTVRTFLHEMLVERGAAVVEAETGEQGLHALETAEPFDLILLDLSLPGLDGLELLRRLRLDNETSAVVIVTGKGDIRSATVAVRRGADGYIEKQYLVRDEGEFELFGALDQAVEHRAGIVAKRELEQVRADFYSMVTHDLRSPTGSLLMAIRMLIRPGAEELTADQRELLSVCERSAMKLLDFINDYLDYAKIEAGYLRLDRRPPDLTGLTGRCLELLRPRAAAKDQRLVVALPEGEMTVSVDAERFEQVIDNLVGNAIKYTPEGGSIKVRLADEAGTIRLAVQDTGCGIPPEQLGALFTKYHRVPGESRRGVSGTGLGLLIVKQIVEAHGGVVAAESDGVPGHGTTFIVRLPLAAE